MSDTDVEAREAAAGRWEPIAHQQVVPLEGEWVGRCYHGEETWEIHRGTEYAAWRSLRAHARECPAQVPHESPTEAASGDRRE